MLSENHLSFFVNTLAGPMFEPPSDEKASDWCERCVIIPPPQTQSPGKLSFSGREYCRESVDDFGDWSISDQVLCWGSQTAKTTHIQAGAAYIVANHPTGLLWVMPSIDLARSFSETRWIPIIENSPELAKMKPTGSARFAFKKLQQQLGGSIINFVGSNSAANLASRPAQVVILDEVDKFNEGGSKEADAVNLAEQRTKSFANPKRVKTSTPTVSSGLIWVEFMKGDQRRYFVPCPHCSKQIVLAWSETFTILPETGKEAYVRWDKEAKRKNGAWDLDRVERSARFVCPHCAADINDAAKTVMNRNGLWVPTAKGKPGFVSRHLPSLYAATPETSCGKLAVKFLQARESLLGLRGFINGDLAEPFESQDLTTHRIEIVVKDEEPPAAGTQTLVVDCQQNAPHFYWMRSVWLPQTLRISEVGFCDTLEELRKVQTDAGVLDRFVALDVGWNRDVVLEHCARYGKRVSDTREARESGIPIHVGWKGWRGVSDKNFRDKQQRAMFPVRMVTEAITPFGQRVRVAVLEMNDKGLKDMLAAMRRGECKSIKLEIAESVASNPDFWRHMDAEILERERIGNKVREQWRLRSDRWPNHWLDCAKATLGKGLWNRLVVDSALSLESKRA